MKKIEIAENFVHRLALAANQYGGRTIERLAEVSSGTVPRIVGGKQKLIGAEILARLSLALERLEAQQAAIGMTGGGGERAGIVPDESEMAGAGTFDYRNDDAELDAMLEQANDSGKQYGRITAALEVIDAIGGEDSGIAAAIDIIEAAVGKLYRAEA